MQRNSKDYYDSPTTNAGSSKSASPIVEKRTCKLLLVGPAKAGKSSLLQAYNGAEFENYETYRPTTTSDFSVKDVKLFEDIEVCLQVWDVGGNSMGRSFLRGSNAIVLVVDLSTHSSMENIDDIYEKVRNFSGFPDDNFPCLLIGNKLDLAQGEKREITMDMMKNWAIKRRPNNSQNKIICMETSAKTKQGVQEVFIKAVEIFIRKPVSVGAPSYRAPTSSVVEKADSVASNRKGGRYTPGPDDESEEEEDIPIAKIVLAGPPNVGKTCMLTRFVSNDLDIPSKHEPTVGADFRVAEMQVNDVTLTLQIWDTAGDKKMLSIGKSLYKNADGVILVYDISSRSSFRSLDVYWDNFLKYSGIDEAEFFPAVLVGNKSDLSAKRAVSLEEVIDWCTNKRPHKQITYLECSAKLDIGVRDVFNFITHAHYDFALSPDEAWTETDFDDTETEYDEAFEPSEKSMSEVYSACGDNYGGKKVSYSQQSGSYKSKSKVSKTQQNDNEKSCWCKFY